jgi:hypothetical protein
VALAHCVVSGALLERAQREGAETFARAALLGLQGLARLLSQPELAGALLAYHADLATRVVAGLDATLLACIKAQASQVRRLCAFCSKVWIQNIPAVPRASF